MSEMDNQNFSEETPNEELDHKKSNKKKVAVAVSAVALLALLGGGGAALYHYNSPDHFRAETEDNVQEVADIKNGEPSNKQLAKKAEEEKGIFGKMGEQSKNADKKPTFNYDPSKIKGIPSVDDLDKLQDKVVDGEVPVVKRGNIAIPQLDIQSPIYEGTSQYTLSVGLGTAKQGQHLGKGNYALAGHNMTKAVGLNNYFLTNLQARLANNESDLSSCVRNTKGMNAYIADDHYVYQYRLSQAQLVPYTSGNIVLDSYQPYGKNKPMLTLYTCAEQANTTNPYYRIVVHGKQTHKYTIKEFQQKFKKYKHIFEQPTWLKHQ